MATSAPRVLELLVQIRELVSPLATGQTTELDSSFGEKASYALFCIGLLNDQHTKIRDILSSLLSAYGNAQPIDKAKVEEYMSLFDQIRGPRQQPTAQSVDNIASSSVAQQPQPDPVLNEWDGQSVPQVKQTTSNVKEVVTFLTKRYGYPMRIVRSVGGNNTQRRAYYTYECIHGGEPRRNKQIESASTSAPTPASASAAASASASTDIPDTSTVGVNDAVDGDNDGHSLAAASGGIVLAQPKQRASMKVECQFMIQLDALKDGKWEITKLNLNHVLLDGSPHPPLYSSLYLTDEFKQTLLNSFNTGNSISLANVIRVVAAQKRIEEVATDSEYNVMKSFVRYHTRGSAPVNKDLQDLFEVILNSADAIFKPLYGTAVENNSRTLRGAFLSNQRLLNIGKKFADYRFPRLSLDHLYSRNKPLNLATLGVRD
ncbi:hypothetical protein GQ42DRAFT_153322 [Ramicandelaber brevisporus]|nr:hypothetical protein GQ42DRAFT_153322 [Ramicandelaber brevisporus]